MEYYLLSEGMSVRTAEFSEFSEPEIKKAIISHLTKNPNDLLELVKKDGNKNRFDTVISLYEVNPKNGKPSLIVTKGCKTYYKSLIN